MLGLTFGLAIKAGIIVGMFTLSVELFALARPIIPRRQRRFLTVFLPATLFCFVGGAAFAYYVMLPAGLKFLLHFGSNVAVPLITIRQYMDLLTAMMFWLGLVFELPLGMFLAAKMRIFTYQKMKRVRKFVPFMAFVLSAIITPTVDPINSTIIAVPIIALYEVGLFLSWLAHPEEGNYLFMKTLWSILRWPLWPVRWACGRIRR